MSSYGFVAPMSWSIFRSIVALRSRAHPHATLDAICDRALVDVADAPGFTRGFYSQRERIGVAGYKSNIHALEALYALHHVPTLYRYECVVREAAPRTLLHALVEKLLLGARPFDDDAPVAPWWPAHDAALLLGWLDPVETRMLAQRLPAWEQRVSATPMSDRLFERVRAAARANVAVVALHAML